MAGGMRGGRGPTLAERAGASPRSPEHTGEARHCWVVDAPGHPGRWPALLVEWRRGSDGWEGRAIYVLPEVPEPGSRVVERWLPASCLEALPQTTGTA